MFFHRLLRVLIKAALIVKHKSFDLVLFAFMLFIVLVFKGKG